MFSFNFKKYPIIVKCMRIGKFYYHRAAIAQLRRLIMIVKYAMEVGLLL